MVTYGVGFYSDDNNEWIWCLDVVGKIYKTYDLNEVFKWKYKVYDDDEDIMVKEIDSIL